MASGSTTLYRIAMFAGLAIAMAGATALAIYLTIQVRASIEVVTDRSPQWTVNHTELEFTRLRHQIAVAQLNPDFPLDELRLKFDILYSRLEAIQTGNLSNELREKPEFIAELQKIRNYLEASAHLIDLDDVGLRDALGQLSTLSAEAAPDFRSLSLVTLNNWQANTGIRQRELLATLRELATVLVVFFASLLALIVILLRLIRIEGQQRAQLLATTDRAVQSEQSLRESEARLREAQSIAKLGNWEIGKKGGANCSPEFLKIVGANYDDYRCGMESFLSRVHPDDVEMVKDRFAACWQTGADLSFTHRLRLAEGHVRTVRQEARASKDPTGQVESISGTIQDISKQQDADDRLRQAQKMEVFGQMTGGVAHDFNNILAVILGNLELIQDETELDTIQVYAAQGAKAAMQGASLTQSLLSFARKSQVEPVELDLNTFVGVAQSWWSRVLPETITVELDLSDGLHTIEADEGLTQSAILNLLLNARDAMPNGGRITIETGNEVFPDGHTDRDGDAVPAGTYVYLAVHDTGPGIAQHLLDRIFEPFFTTKPTGAGSGLGLAMVQGFLKQSGGWVCARSEPGKGSRLALYFPKYEAAGGARNLPLIGQPHKRTGHARILLVEDETDVLRVLSATLTSAGYSFETAKSGDDAWTQWAGDNHFDLLVTDVVMPGKLQGHQLAQKIRETRPDIPVLFLTGYAPEAVTANTDGEPLSRDLTLIKPASRAQLVEAIEKLLKPEGIVHKAG